MSVPSMGVLLSGGADVWVVVVSRVCRLQPGVKAALNPNERFMEGVSGVTDATYALMASPGVSNLLGVRLYRVDPAGRF